MTDLPRLRPEPIPAIHPLPEYLAGGLRKAWYEDMKQEMPECVTHVTGIICKLSVDKHSLKDRPDEPDTLLNPRALCPI